MTELTTPTFPPLDMARVEVRGSKESCCVSVDVPEIPASEIVFHPEIVKSDQVNEIC